MRLVVRLLGTELLAVELHPPERLAPPAPERPPAPCRFQPPERPRLEAGGMPHIERAYEPSFGFGPPPCIPDLPDC